MDRFSKLVLFFCFIHLSAFAAEIKTFYGTLDVEEPVLLELIESPAFQRLKEIHQYGVAYYTTHREEYTRYDHSLGVFYLLRVNGCPLKEQIAGLLHDVSHTVFSHVGDWIFNRQDQEQDFQTLTHRDYLEKSGLGDILIKYGYTAEQMEPKQELFPALEQPLPNLCADRLDYNIQGAYYRDFISLEEAIAIASSTRFEEGIWTCHRPDLAKKLAHYSLIMTENCWGSPTNYVQSMWLAEAMLKAVEKEQISIRDIRFGVDKEIWSRLLESDDPHIQHNMRMVLNPSEYFTLVSLDEADLHVVSKFRGINPAVIEMGKKKRINELDTQLEEAFYRSKELMGRGWAIKFINSEEQRQAS